MANELSLENKLAPGRIVTVCFPALIKSGSSVPARGKGPWEIDRVRKGRWRGRGI